MVLGLGGAAARLGSSVGSRLAGSAGASGAAGLGIGSVVGDLTGTSPADILPFSSAGSTGTDGGGLFGGQTIIWVFAGIALLAAVSNIAGE